MPTPTLLLSLSSQPPQQQAGQWLHWRRHQQCRFFVGGRHKHNTTINKWWGRRWWWQQHAKMTNVEGKGHGNDNGRRMSAYASIINKGWRQCSGSRQQGFDVIIGEGGHQTKSGMSRGGFAPNHQPARRGCHHKQACLRPALNWPMDSHHHLRQCGASVPITAKVGQSYSLVLM